MHSLASQLQQQRAQLNSTPIKNRPLSQQQTIHRNGAMKTDRIPHQMHDNTVVYDRSACRTDVSPKQNITLLPKPLPNLNSLATPKKFVTCSNHPTKEAEYRIQLEDDMLFYCEKCSALLASQGFQVNRIGKMGSANQSTGCRMSSESTDKKSGRYSEIRQFCDSAKALIIENQDNAQYMRGLQTHYLEQEQLIEEFHNGIMNYLSQIKQQHLKMLRTQSRKFLQIAEIQKGEIEENSTELSDIVSDIEGNMSEIVTTLSEDRYREVMNLYQQKLSLFTHHAEEQRTSFQGITNVQRRDLEKKLAEFGRLMSQFFSTDSNKPTQGHSQSTKKMCAQNEKLIKLAKMTKQQEKGPFRNLRFDEIDVVESPVFREL